MSWYPGEGSGHALRSRPYLGPSVVSGPNLTELALKGLRKLIEVLDIAVIKPLQILVGLLLVATIFYWLQFGFGQALCKVASLTGADILCLGSGGQTSGGANILPTFEELLASEVRPADLFWTYVGIAVASLAQGAFAAFLARWCRSESTESYRSGFLWLGDVKQRQVASFDYARYWMAVFASAALWGAALYGAVVALDARHPIAMVGFTNDALVTLAVGATAWLASNAVGALMSGVESEYKNTVAGGLVFLAIVSMAAGSSAFASGGAVSLRSCGTSSVEVLRAAQEGGLIQEGLAFACMQPPTGDAATAELYAIVLRPSSDRMLRPCSVGVRHLQISSREPVVGPFQELATYAGEYCQSDVSRQNPRAVGEDVLQSSNGRNLAVLVTRKLQER